MNPVNVIIYNKKDFGTDVNLYSKIAQQIQLLMETNNVITIRSDEEKTGVICIEYGPRNPSLGYPYPYWLLPQEAIYVAEYHDKLELEKYKNFIEELDEFENDYNKEKNKNGGKLN